MSTHSVRHVDTVSGMNAVCCKRHWLVVSMTEWKETLLRRPSYLIVSHQGRENETDN